MKPVLGIDLFCGGGGASEGFENGGISIVLAVDSWAEALKVHRANHPTIPTLQLELGGDIPALASVLWSYLPEDRSSFHFHLHASPPCQALSQASKQSALEGVDMLTWYFDLIAYMKPDSWTMENVIPAIKYLPESMNYYAVQAADFGVPQIRRRVFAGEGWALKPTHQPDEYRSIRDALPYIEGELQEFVNTKIKPRTLDQPIRCITSCSHSQCRLIDENGDKIRSLTIEEHAVLMGWPNMVFPYGVKKKDLWRIVGNMIVPPVAENIAKSIVEGCKNEL